MVYILYDAGCRIFRAERTKPASAQGRSAVRMAMKCSTKNCFYEIVYQQNDRPLAGCAEQAGFQIVAFDRVGRPRYGQRQVDRHGPQFAQQQSRGPQPVHEKDGRLQVAAACAVPRNAPFPERVSDRRSDTLLAWCGAARVDDLADRDFMPIFNVT